MRLTIRGVRAGYFLVLGSLALVVAACTDPAAPDAAAPRAELTVLRTTQNPQEILPFTPSVRVEGRNVRILGQVRTPTPCYELASRLDALSNTITLTVRVSPTGAEVCGQVLVVRDYGATIHHLRPGSYTVRVVHFFTEQQSPSIVLEERVTVQ